MISTIVAIALLQQTAITVPAGYYTLQELASSLAAQDVPVRAGGDCAEDVYAIRVENTTWPRLRNALQGDDRLVVTLDKGFWKIGRSYATQSAEAVALRKYLVSAAAQIYAVYGFAAQKCRELEAMSKPEADAQGVAFASGPYDTPAKAASSQLIYLCYETEVPYWAVETMAKITSPQVSPMFGQVLKTNFYDAVGVLMAPTFMRGLRVVGIDASKLSLEELASFTRTIELRIKLALDPVTLTASGRFFWLA